MVLFVLLSPQELRHLMGTVVLVRAGFEVHSVGVKLAGEHHVTLSRGVKIIPDENELNSSISIVCSPSFLVWLIDADQAMLAGHCGPPGRRPRCKDLCGG